uniref:Uncharacterized protein n=1 Tax=Anguilla anguilla TaxID=7936 RepID=A0A0E9WRN1_ANGAN
MFILWKVSLVRIQTLCPQAFKLGVAGQDVVLTRWNIYI